jgi:putative membrane protein
MKQIHRFASFSAAIVLFAATTAAVAQAGASDDDKHFVEAALKGGMSEVDLGQLAVKRGNSEDVKAFGQKMVDDHTKMGDKMKEVASQIGVTPPSMSTMGDMGEKAKLDVLSGDSFDKAYISAMVKDHEDDLAAFRKEAATGTSPAVKAAARQDETVIAHHLAMIRKIAAAHNVTASYRKPSAGTLASASAMASVTSSR